MKFLLKHIVLFFKDVKSGGRVIYFFLLLATYYIVNLLTSPINSGMSGGMEAEHNIYNQLLGGFFVVYVLFCDVALYVKRSSWIIRVLTVFLIYIAIRTYMGYALDHARHSIFSFTSIVNFCYWGGGLIFCIKFFQFCKADKLRRMIQFIVLVFLCFVTYRLFTQKALLARLGLFAGINQATAVYYVVPLIIMVFKGKLRIILYLFCAFICIYSAKRQAVVGLGIVTLLNFKILFQAYIRRRNLLLILSFVAVLHIGRGFVRKISYGVMHRQERLEELGDEDSGRYGLWEAAINGFQNASNKAKWLGGGPGTGNKYIGSFFPIARAPHNGFIQVLCDFGYIGLATYVLFFLTLISCTIRIRGTDNKLLYLSFCSSWIFANIISHPASPRMIFLAIGIGYIFYLQANERNKISK